MRLRNVAGCLALCAGLVSACGAEDKPELGSSDFDASAQLLTLEFQPVPPGQYLVETLGFPFSLTVGDNWFVQPNSDGFTVLTDPDSFGTGDRDVAFIRPTGLNEPSDPTKLPSELPPWPVEDIEGWLERLNEDVIVSEPQEVLLGGREALTFDLQLGPDFECGLIFCAAFVDVRGEDGKVLNPDTAYRIWWVDGGEYEPLAVVVGGGPTGKAFFETAESLLSTIAFGAPEPHPMPANDG